MKGALALFRFLGQAVARGERTALVTITDIVGRSSRAPGTHMAVSETGAFHGSLSGGCVEQAVVGEARRVIAEARARKVRFGVGSPYIDIRLPCGGGLDLMIVPEPASAVITSIVGALAARQSVALVIDEEGALAVAPGNGASTGWRDGRFIVRHDPELRLVVAGHGMETEALAALGRVYGADMLVLSPDSDIVARVRKSGVAAFPLRTLAPSPDLRTDPHTAVITLFHDHDWEEALLAQALEQDAFFIGAMGSRVTHARRLDRLRERGVPEASLSRIIGPIGLIPATRDPETLALSALGHAVAAYGEKAG